MSATRKSHPRGVQSSRFSVGRPLLALLALALAAVGCSPLIKIPSNPFLAKPTRKPPHSRDITGNAIAIHYSHNGEFMAVLTEPAPADNPLGRELPTLSANRGDRALLLFNTSFQKPLEINPPCLAKIGRPRDIAFDKSGHLLIVSKSEEGDLSLQKIVPGEEEKKVETVLPSPLPYRDALLSRGGDWLAGQWDDGTWELTDLEDPKRVLSFPTDKPLPDSENGPITVVRIVDFSADGSLIATEVVDADRTESEKKPIVIWDLKAPRSVPIDDAILPLTPLFVTSFFVNEPSGATLGRFSPSSSSIAFRSKENCVAVYQSANGALLTELGEHEKKISALDFAPTTPKLAIGLEGEDGTLFLWDIRKGTILRSRADRAEDDTTGSISALTFVPDGTIVQYGTSREEIRQWNIRAEMKAKEENKSPLDNWF
ncbi:MAG: hypothetical protein IJG25_01045 [Thermoguttaceae bacterium]|nr:hypothetical protein [Thermoguttaceae bacterium]MBQ6619906.1 hypothetical protein [Thermoguttaceae bacterium]MBR2585321.1 hypothetical protein [Thermoguttaceae bacterium]